MLTFLFKFLTSLHPLSNLSLHGITIKLTRLLALTTAQRAQTLVLLDLNYMKKHICSSRVELMKTSEVSHPFYEVILKPFKQSKLCVVNTVNFYIKKTEFRKPSKLLVSYKTGKNVSTSTLASRIC